MYSETDLLLEELALNSAHPDNTDVSGGRNPDGEVMSKTNKNPKHLLDANLDSNALDYLIFLQH